MKLLNEIVDLLSSKDGSLTDALLKTKVLMHKIGHQELAGWVNDELNGYPSGKDVPEYRVIPARLLADVANTAWRQSNQQVPLSHLTDELRRTLSENRVHQPIRVLEQYAATPNGSLQLPVSPEFQHTFNSTLAKNGWIEKMWTQIEVTQIIHLLIEVRSRLLDFALVLQHELDEVEEEDVKEVAKGIDAPAMFHGAVFGDNTVVVVGDHNQTTISNEVKKGDFESLAALFKKGKVEDGDIIELKDAIAADGVPKQGHYGERVKVWLGKMTGKAIDGTWTIGIRAAGTLLADGLKAFFGW